MAPRQSTGKISAPKRAMANLTVRPAAVKFASGKTSFLGRLSRDSMMQDEYIAEVNGSVAFATTPYPFNPGQSGVFPRFSKEAVLYEKWVCVSAEFYFKPEVSQFATNGTTGKVMLSFDYDASDAPPGTKQQVQDTYPHADGMPWESVKLTLDPVELNVTPRGKFVRPGGLPGSSDIKMYDGGILYVSTVANQSASVIGELRVRYHFVLHKPVLENPVGVPVNYHTSALVSVLAQAIVSSAPTLLLLPNVLANGIPVVNASGVITLPQGNYVILGDVSTSCTSINYATISLLISGVAAAFAPQISSATLTTSLPLSGSWFVQSNGATTVSLSLLASGSGITAFSSLVIMSV
jgi:hypothetical protein